MENQKSSESTNSSSGKISKRAKTKTEKNSPENYITNIRKTWVTGSEVMAETIYIKMTQKIELNEKTTYRELLQNHMGDLKHRIKDLFIWALSESAITEMTGIIRGKDHKSPNRMDVNRLYSLFRLYFIPERNIFHRADSILEQRAKNTKRQKMYGRESYRWKRTVDLKT